MFLKKSHYWLDKMNAMYQSNQLLGKCLLDWLSIFKLHLSTTCIRHETKKTIDCLVKKDNKNKKEKGVKLIKCKKWIFHSLFPMWVMQSISPNFYIKSEQWFI